MLYFDHDYMEGAHPAILQRLMETNMEHTYGYGKDAYCESAKAKIRTACQCPEAEIYFLVGGTQTNATVIRGFLKPFEGVIAADTGHIGVHEAGAIESGGHKVLTIPHKNGKLEAAAVKHYLERFYQDGSCTHMVQPGMVYISHPTEYGTLYTKEELKALRKVCEEYQLPLFLDGARLGYGLCAPGTDVTLADLAKLCDVFYIGGTKVGALFGEAVVFPKKNTVPGFFTLMKQQGAVLAKGRLLYINSPTNQQFVVLNAAQREALKDRVSCETWEELENGAAAVRFASSWATKSEDVEELGRILKTLPGTECIKLESPD